MKEEILCNWGGVDIVLRIKDELGKRALKNVSKQLAKYLHENHGFIFETK